MNRFLSTNWLFVASLMPAREIVILPASAESNRSSFGPTTAGALRALRRLSFNVRQLYLTLRGIGIGGNASDVFDEYLDRDGSVHVGTV